MNVAGALAALLLLPGVLVVRAPWTAVPFLSLFFWIASWWWLPSTGRARAVGAFLLAFLLAGVLRLLRFDGRWPSWPALAAVGAALVHAAAFVARGPARLEATAAQLMSWHDGLPSSYVPLREAGAFGAHAHGWDALAADIGHLSGLPVPRALALAAAVAGAASSLGLYALLARVYAAAPAAIATLAASLAAALAETAGFGLGAPSALAVGFVLAAAALAARARSRASAVAAGAFTGTALMTAPWVVAAGMALGAAAAAAGWRRLSAPECRALARRLGLAALAAVLTAAPFLLRIAASFLRL